MTRADDLTAFAEPGVAVALDLPYGPPVVRIRENNPGMFTGPGTNTFLIGDQSLWILDPGEDRDDGHRAAILDAVRGRPVEGILVSHGHPDHWPLGERLTEDLGAETYGCVNPASAFQPKRTLAHGQAIEGLDFQLKCLHTPGHCADHFSFVLHGLDTKSEPKVVFCGDHVMAWSTTILAPPDGNLNQYLASLDALIDLKPALLIPAHGPEITEPIARMKALREHRLERSRQLLSVLKRGPLTLAEAVPLIYTDIDPKLFGAAAASMSAHADALVENGLLHRNQDRLQLR